MRTTSFESIPMFSLVMIFVFAAMTPMPANRMNWAICRMTIRK